MDGKIVIDGDASGVVKMMQQAAQAVRGFQTQTEGSLGKVQSAIAAAQAKWVMLGTTILGGAGFKQAVDASVNLTKEAAALGKALGVSATEASVLKVALGDIHQEQETLTGANTALTKTLKDNEDAFAKLGVKTRDQNGHFRGSLDVMLEVNKRLLDFKEGTDRNIEGMKIYGKRWEEVSGLLKLTGEQLEESRKKAEALNLVVGAESVEATANYRAAMGDVGDVMLAVKKAVGDAVMPVLTDLGNEFSNTGPQKIEIMRKSIAVLVAGFYGLKNGVELAWTFIKASIEAMTVRLLTFAEVGAKALTFDFSGATEAWRRGTEQYKDILSKAGQDMIGISRKNGEAMQKALQLGFNPQITTPTQAGAGAGGTSVGGNKTKDDSRLRQWEAELAEFKLKEEEKAQAEGRFFQMSKDAERKFWQDKLVLAEAGSKEHNAVRLKLATVGRDIMREQYEAEQEALKLGMEAARDAYQARLIYMDKYVENARQRFGAESKEYKAALKEQETMRREHEARLRQIDMIRLDTVRAASAAMIDENSRVVELEAELGLITRQQLLQQQRGYIEEKMRLDLQAADYELSLYREDTVEYERILARKLEIKRRYDALLGENTNAQILEKLKPETNVFNSLQSSLEAANTAMLMGTQSWAQAMGSIYRSTASIFIQEMISKPMAEWVAGWARKLALNLGFLGTENAQKAAAALTTTGIATTTAGVEIGANAAVAGSGAAAAVAKIPFVGPALALAAMAAIFAAVSGMRNNVKSAAGGFDIPRGMNPMTQLHEEEMVLPAKYANGLRDLINGGVAGQDGSGPAITYNDHSGRLTPNDIRRNVRIIAEALRDYSKKQ